MVNWVIFFTINYLIELNEIFPLKPITQVIDGISKQLAILIVLKFHYRLPQMNPWYSNHF